MHSGIAVAYVRYCLGDKGDRGEEMSTPKAINLLREIIKLVDESPQAITRNGGVIHLEAIKANERDLTSILMLAVDAKRELETSA